jgi:stage II sporulation protein AA (anti-sigma F factor antagonist)
MINISPVILQFFRLNRLWDLFHSRVFQGLNEILEMIRSKNSKPLFYLVSEAKHKLSYLELVGRLDSSQISKLDMKALTEDIGDKNCILNLDKLSFVDSTGLILFLKLWKHVTHRNNSIILCSIPDNIMQTLRITKLANLFRTAADVSSAEVALEGEA